MINALYYYAGKYYSIKLVIKVIKLCPFFVQQLLKRLGVVPSHHNQQPTELLKLAPTQLVLLTMCIVITRRAIASAEGRAVLNSDSYVINRNWKSLIMFGCSESNKTVYKRAQANQTGNRDARLRAFQGLLGETVLPYRLQIDFSYIQIRRCVRYGKYSIKKKKK